MENFKNILDDIESITNGEILKKGKDKVIPLLTITIGALCMIFNNQKYHLIDNDTLINMLFAIGLFIFVCGLCIFFIQKERYITKSNVTLKMYNLEYNSNDTDKLIKLHNNSDYSNMKELAFDKVSSGLHLIILCAEDNSLCYTQVQKYVPYNFEPATECQIVDNSKISDVRNLISTSK